jgi:PhzF family phenazine biosynthesis protein
MTDVERYSAFSDQPEGGNPAGVVLDATGLDANAMQAIATEVGYSETAFLARRDAPATFAVRYFSPLAEVPFCGHATIATGVALARRDGPGLVTLETQAGTVPVRTDVDAQGLITATLTSVAPRVEATPPELVERALNVLGWTPGELDASLPPRVAFAGARHLVLAAATRERLARLDYEFDALRELMLEHDLTTLQLVWREAPLVFHARDPFPVGGVVEDPATGAAAAAFGGYLRELGLIAPPTRVTIHQGHDLGRPSLLLVDVDAGRPEIQVTGAAVPIET